MPTTIQLGKNTTISGLTGVQDVSMTTESEKVDATTKGSTGVYKRTVAGLTSRMLEATVLGDATQSYGKQVAVTVGGFSITGVVTSAKRTQPIAGAEAVSITIKPGIALDAGDQVTI
jgi:orotidine-5'-phosphate decarboxylase